MFLTIFTGVAILVAGQIIVKLFIELIQEQRKIRGRVVDTLTRPKYIFARLGMFVEHDSLVRDNKPLTFDLTVYTSGPGTKSCKKFSAYVRRPEKGRHTVNLPAFMRAVTLPPCQDRLG